MGDYFLFGLVFIKKSNQTEIFKKKKQNRFKSTGFSSVRFFWTKTGLAWFFQFGSVFSVWLGFFSGFFRFGFSSFFSVLGL
jgi:hypothetical protein